MQSHGQTNSWYARLVERLTSTKKSEGHRYTRGLTGVTGFFFKVAPIPVVSLATATVGGSKKGNRGNLV